MFNLEKLSKEISDKINNDKNGIKLSEYAFKSENAIRRKQIEKDNYTVIRSSFCKDIDKIMNCPFFNRYADKTQVFSFYKNDDISRRILHVQLVSRIARNIGNALNLNTELIEAIALGHDIGHTPFGHAGEKILDEIYNKKCGRRFRHNVHSVRVLDEIFPYNISLQTLNGILSHDGEIELMRYEPQKIGGFEEFDKIIENCYLHKEYIKQLVPDTLEACVVRISDIIAYIGKDRQDAEKIGLLKEDEFNNSKIGKYNFELINNLTVNIIENSYGKPYISMDEKHFKALKEAKLDDSDLIYKNDKLAEKLTNIKPMMSDIFNQLFDDLINKKLNSPIFTHHINYVNKAHYDREIPYEKNLPEQIVVDYIAGMTDDYFIDLYNYLFPNGKYEIKYKGYFD